MCRSFELQNRRYLQKILEHTKRAVVWFSKRCGILCFSSYHFFKRTCRGVLCGLWWDLNDHLNGHVPFRCGFIVEEIPDFSYRFVRMLDF